MVTEEGKLPDYPPLRQVAEAPPEERGCGVTNRPMPISRANFSSAATRFYVVS
jgi:hypothetical protein